MPPAPSPFPRLRLRRPTPELLDLPWATPLAEWPSEELHFRDLPVGPSRHLVRFLVRDSTLYALKEEPLDVAEREFTVLRHLEEEGLPSVRPIGIAVSPDRGSGVLATEYLTSSLQYRRLLSRFPPGPGQMRDRLLDAMAGLLVELHRSGVYWGDCSLANTLFRRDADRIQAYLVDAETSEVHPALSDGQRSYDLDVLVENVAFGLADLAAQQDREDLIEEAVDAAEGVRSRYLALWDELHAEEELRADDRHAVAKRIRRLNELGFAVDEIELVPGTGGHLRLRAAVTSRRFHARELERLTEIEALEGQAQLLLNDLREYRSWLEAEEGKRIDPEVAGHRWRHAVLDPTIARLLPVIGPGRDPLQAYSDLLEMKWLMSEAAGRDVGLEQALDAYLAAGAPAPESVPAVGREPGRASPERDPALIAMAQLDVDGEMSLHPIGRRRTTSGPASGSGGPEATASDPESAPGERRPAPEKPPVTPEEPTEGR
jgi:tRNA A-37 threonylcarbamoyl transferase component Bud32